MTHFRNAISKSATQKAVAMTLSALASLPMLVHAQSKAPTVNISDGVVKMGLLLDMIGDVAASATALAAAEVARQKNKVIIMSGPGTSRLTNENCSPVSVHYAWDTYALSAVTGRGVVKGGGDSWFFITADYAFGHSLEKDASDITAKVMAWMKANPINDMFVKNGRIREDGRMMREMYLLEVKDPSESKYPWDYYKLKAFVPAEQAFMPISKSVCPLLKKS